MATQVHTKGVTISQGPTIPLPPSPHTHARSICNVRFHTFRLVRYGRMGVPTDKATYGVGSLRLKTAQCRQIKTRPDTRPIPLADGWRKCAFSRLPTRSPRTDQRTDQRTDKASYRVACPQFFSFFFFSFFFYGTLIQ